MLEQNMPSNGKHLYRFGEFSLDTEQNILLRAGKPVALTPKMLELFRVLITNHGRIVEKEDLMTAVWSDSFVEEGNLKFTVNQLRKALGDDARNPLYIETVPRRGYRFIAEIEEILSEDKTNVDLRFHPASISQNDFDGDDIKPWRGFQAFKNYFAVIGFSGFLLVSSFAFSSWYFNADSKRKSDIPILYAPRKSEPLSYSSNIFRARISPDGKYIVYASENQGKQTVWLREMATTTNLQLLPFSDEEYLNLMFSSKSDFIYFVRKPRGASQDQTSIFRISIFGGVPTKLITDTQGWFSLSPIDDQIAFTRFEPDGQSVLMISDTDGKNQRTLAARERPYNFLANRWSPDGLRVASAVGQTNNLANEFRLLAFDIETGEEREITPRKFFSVSDLEWLPDKSGLLFTARENSSPNNQIWQVEAASGEAVKLFDEAVNYTTISLDKEAKQMVATQVVSDFNLSVADFAGLGNSHTTLSSVSGTSYFTPSGKILYSALTNGQGDVFVMNADGSQQRQLTYNSFDDFHSRASQDEKYIFFTSNRSGDAQVWRMNADGSGQIQITQKEGRFPLFITPDGNFLFYWSALNRNLWKVSVGGGEETLFLDKRIFAPAFSADGKKIAYLYRDQEHNNAFKIAVMSVQTKQIINSFNQFSKTPVPVQIAWAADGESIFFAAADDSGLTLWQQRLDDKTPQKIAGLGSKEILDFSLSPAGDKFALVSGEWKRFASLLKGFK
ncbi:MAG: winged helix-turn-helix domain-containing protein [Pyrinomonadaceae bacterium]